MGSGTIWASVLNGGKQAGMDDLIVIGGGLAGCEAAWQAAERGLSVSLFEMRPDHPTGAHVTSDLAELVCSNSLGSHSTQRASGLLKEELRLMGSLLLACAEETAVPAGGSLAVDRGAFASLVTERIQNHPNITLIREEVTFIPTGPVIVASGPLTSAALAQSIQDLTGQENLFFFDAIAPIVRGETIDLSIAFRGTRYGMEEGKPGDYINCPMSREEYDHFIQELIHAERIPLRSFEQQIAEGVTAGAHQFFEGCLPVEILAARENQALAYGPMRPVGLTNSHNNQRYPAVVQLRQDNLAGTLYNMVGFQTNLTYAEQKRVFRMIPGLEKAEFERYGQMHRNTFIAAPLVLKPTLQMRSYDNLFFAGQIVGVEGYLGNIATGLLAGLNASRLMRGQSPCTLPRTTMLGGLLQYITQAELKDFQPMKANFGILPPLPSPARFKPERGAQYAQRALADLSTWAQRVGFSLQEQLPDQETKL